ncbi:MAG: MaoC/PaaZ C-terminal domain-containing protein [Acidimicrobiales bacterium]|nr:MaoC/PaaZ C-terminal domain-containing protein [Acidimicrobiales bacterium]HJL98022.1 MaoC/PaaZ C-terminal domain-containing protein [Acidimicrobiales bacterium]
MPVPTDMVGDQIGPITHAVDARWVMAYSAALGDTQDCYFDTRRDDGIVAHPMFAVCPEWPVIVEGRELADKWGITPEETRQSVHATHDLVIHRLARPGDVLETRLTYTGVENKSPGAYTTMKLETFDADGHPVFTTYQGGMYLGVPAEGEDRPAQDTPEIPDLGALPGEPLAEILVPVTHGAAHTYTESARIWNPIHTDASVAEAAGLPAIILHGTATLALGVSATLSEVADGNPERVRRIRGRMASMVLMPSTVTVRILDVTPVDGQDVARFEVLTEDGGPAINQGLVFFDKN